MSTASFFGLRVKYSPNKYSWIFFFFFLCILVFLWKNNGSNNNKNNVWSVFSLTALLCCIERTAFRFPMEIFLLCRCRQLLKMETQYLENKTKKKPTKRWVFSFLQKVGAVFHCLPGWCCYGFSASKAVVDHLTFSCCSTELAKTWWLKWQNVSLQSCKGQMSDGVWLVSTELHSFQNC